MRKTLCILLCGLFFLTSSQAQTNAEVEELFKLKCAICHTIGGGKLIGPDLMNVQDRHSREWLMSFISSSQSMIKRGDSTAVALYNEHGQVEMPDPMISDNEIRAIIDYIAEQSAKGGGVSQPYVSILEDATQEDFENGKELFQGRKRLANKGPSCISCHNELGSSFFSENSYSAKDIRVSFSTLGEQGVRAILESPPFPVMAKAFEDHSLREEEVHDLLVFLRDAGVSATSASASSGYLLYGLLGMTLLLFFLAWIWYERKNKTVNEEIFRRQIRSVN